MPLLLALGWLGCNGAIDGGARGPTGAGPNPGGPGPAQPGGPSGSGGPSGGGSTGGGSGPGVSLPMPGSDPLEPDRTQAACKQIQTGPAPIRRLTRNEYDATVRDLLGEDKGLAKGFPGEELQHSFDNSAELRSVSDVLAENYVSAAREIGKTVTGKLGSFLDCDPGKDGESACLDRFLDGFGTRLWRRPLEAEQRADLKLVFMNGKSGGSFADGIDAVVRVMVLSPQFMYRIERGVPVAGQSVERLDHWDMASRLSYLLWGSMPDAQLFDAAKAGKLGTRPELAAQARRMLDDPKATAMITNFAGQWLHLRELTDADKDTTIYPAWKEEYPALFRQETEAFIAEVWKQDAKVDTLLSAPFTMMNGPLAAFYGVKGMTPTGAAFTKVALDPAQRAGVLTQAGLLAAKSGPDQSSPILRGVFVREQMFCQPLAQPPADVNANPPELNNTMTTKQRFAAHRDNPACESCHKLIDPIGFGFERYDATGAWRTTENGKPVDATGELSGTDVDGPFDGAVALGRKLVDSKDVESCVAKHWFHFAVGREASDLDRCTVETLTGNFARTGGDLRQLLLATVQTDAFFFKGSQP